MRVLLGLVVDGLVLKKSSEKTPEDAIYDLVRAAIRRHGDSTSMDRISLAEAQDIATKHGYNKEQFEACLTTYEQLGVWHIGEARRFITMLS